MRGRESEDHSNPRPRQMNRFPRAATCQTDSRGSPLRDDVARGDQITDVVGTAVAGRHDIARHLRVEARHHRETVNQGMRDYDRRRQGRRAVDQRDRALLLLELLHARLGGAYNLVVLSRIPETDLEKDGLDGANGDVLGVDVVSCHLNSPDRSEVLPLWLRVGREGLPEIGAQSRKYFQTLRQLLILPRRSCVF